MEGCAHPFDNQIQCRSSRVKSAVEWDVECNASDRRIQCLSRPRASKRRRTESGRRTRAIAPSSAAAVGVCAAGRWCKARIGSCDVGGRDGGVTELSGGVRVCSILCMYEYACLSERANTRELAYVATNHAKVDTTIAHRNCVTSTSLRRALTLQLRLVRVHPPLLGLLGFDRRRDRAHERHRAFEQRRLAVQQHAIPHDCEPEKRCSKINNILENQVLDKDNSANTVKISLLLDAVCEVENE